MRAIYPWIVALLLIVGAAFGIWYFDDAADVRDAEADNVSVDGTPVGGLSTLEHSDQAITTPRTDNRVSSHSTRESSETTTAKVGRVVTPTTSQSESHPGQQFSGADGIDPTGIPFPVSNSVKRECEKLADLDVGNCSDHFAALSQLEKEGRDQKWAPAMEYLIASLVAARPGFFIRSLDCRTNVCAVEVEAEGVVFRIKDKELGGKLSEVDHIFAYERNKSMPLVKVVSITFRRVADAR